MSEHVRVQLTLAHATEAEGMAVMDRLDEALKRVFRSMSIVRDVELTFGEAEVLSFVVTKRGHELLCMATGLSASNAERIARMSLGVEHVRLRNRLVVNGLCSSELKLHVVFDTQWPSMAI